ncbi:MAG: hypothetical protein P1Q69_11210 [Candidatus Thorarchaeota archaeon]|nr:hypothetical protein [Candidatus Thorarchaeota archaeon]
MEPSRENEETPAFDKNMYMDILREDPPMKRYVSRGDTPDHIDIEGPHEDADVAISRVLRFVMSDGMPRFQPILGSAGMGKTHLYWALKDRENTFSKGKYLAIYIPSPPAPVRVPLHFHACIVDEAGEQLFENAVDMLIMKFGGLKGVTHEMYDYSYALERLLVDYPGISADVVKVLLRYRLDPAQRTLARRWLFGDALSHDEIDQLDVRTMLEEDDVTLATLKLLLEGSEVPVVLFIDEMEGPYNTHGEEGERHFLEIIKRLYNESRNVLIVTSCLTEIWERIYEVADAPTRSRMETPVHLREFTKEDIVEFITESMNKYWNEQNIDAPPDPVFPLTMEDIDEVFVHSNGNPREALRFIIPRIDKILFDKEPEPLEEQADYVIKLTAPVVINAAAKTLEEAGKAQGIEMQLLMAKGVGNKQATALLSFRKGEDEKKVCIDIANVKDWDRSGGVAAYYSVKRLQNILDDGEADLAIVVVPEATGGAKFLALSDELGDKLTIIRLTEDSATDLVDEVTKGSISKEKIGLFSDNVQKMF